MNQLFRKLVVGLAVLALVFFFANLLVDNPYTHRLLRTALDHAVTESTNLTVDFKAIKVGVAPLVVDLYGLSVATNVAPDAPLLTASHVRARLSVWALVLGTLRLAKVDVSDLAVIWPPPWNFKGFLKETDLVGPPSAAAGFSWPPRFDLRVNEISLKNAKAFAEVPMFGPPEKASYVTTSVVGLDVDLQYHGWQDVRLDIESKSFDLSIGPKSMVEDMGIEAHMRLSGDMLRVNSLALDSDRLKLKGDGSVAFLTSGDKEQLLSALHLALKGDVQGDLSLLGSFLDVPNTRGHVDGDVAVSADVPLLGQRPKVMFNVLGKGKVHEARLFGFRLFDSQTHFSIDPERVKLDDLELVMGDQTVAKGHGEIRLTEAVDVDFRMRPEGLHLMDLLDALGIQSDVVDLSLSSPDLHLKARGEPFFVGVEATVGATALTLPSTPYDHTPFPIPPSCGVALKLLVTEPSVSFDGTHAVCFDGKSGDLAGWAPPSGTLKVPNGAEAVTPITVSGKILTRKNPAAVQIHVSSEDLDLHLGQYFAELALKGRGSGEADIFGAPAELKVKGTFEEHNVAVRGMPLGNVNGDFAVDVAPMIVSWHRIHADLEGEGDLVAHDGSIDISDDDYQLKGDFSASHIEKEHVGALLAAVAPKAALSFDIEELDATFAGPAFHPFAGKLAGKVKLTDGDFEGMHLFDRLTGGLGQSPRGFASEDLVATLGDLQVRFDLQHERVESFSQDRAEGKNVDVWRMLGLSPKDKVALHIQTLAPKDGVDDQLAALPVVGDTLENADIKGLIELEAKIEGTLGAPQGTVSGALTNTHVFGSAVAPFMIQGFIHGPHLDLVVNHLGNALEGRLAVDLAKDGFPYDWFLHMSRLDLRSLGGEVFSGDPRNYLYLSADWRMKGLLTDWWRSTGELQINDLRGKFVRDIAGQTKTLQVRQDQPVTLLFTDRGWRFDGDKELYLSGRNLQIRLSTQKSRPPERLGLKIESIVDMSLAKEFSQAVETAEGKISVACEIFGPVSDPRPIVEITDLKPNPFVSGGWKPVSLGLADLRPALKNVKMRLVYEAGRLTIDKLSAEKGPSGLITANGTMNFGDSIEESRLDIGLKNVTVVYPVAFLKSFETEASGQVVVSGKGAPYLVAGDVVINKARSTREVDIRNEIINALRQKSFSAAVVTEQPLLAFDLNVSADQSINIHNRNLQAVLSSDLHIRGTDLAPQVSGQIEVNKGRFVYKSDFRITRGLVTFDDPVKPDPALDIQAVSEIDIYRVYTSITGRASNPTVEFSIDPPTRDNGVPIEKLEILVLLSTGKLPDDSRNNGQNAQSAATSEAATLVLGQFEEPLDKLLESSGQNVVHNIYLDTHPSVVDGSPVPRFNLPLDLGDDLDLVLRTDQEAYEISLEYNINENISLNVSGVKESSRADTAQSTTPSTVVTPATYYDTTNTLGNDGKVNLRFRFSFE